MHPLLEKQIETHLGKEWQKNPELAKFMEVINDSYNSLDATRAVEKNKKNESADSQQLSWDLLSSLNTGILVEDENNRVRFANQEFCSMFSLTGNPYALSNLHFQELILQLQPSLLHVDNFLTKLQELRSSKEKKSEIEIELKNKTILELNYVPLFLNGKYQGHLWEYKNITQRKLVENTLRNISNVQRTILNGTNYSIIYTDIHGVVRSFNRGAEEMLGYTADEMIDKNTLEAFHCKDEIAVRAATLSSELKRTVAPEFDALVTMCRNGIVETREWTFIAKEGKKLTVLQSISAIKDAHGEIIGYLSIARDISEQKHAQKILELTEDRYKNIVEKSSDIIYKTNRVGYFTYVNPVAEHITGYSGKELVWMRFLDLIREDYKNKALKFYARQMKKRTPSTYFEFPIVSKSGKEIWIGQSVQYTINESNQVELIALAIDISNQKLAEKKIIESNQKLQLFHNLINNTTDAIQVTTEDGKLFYINKEASSRLGIATEAAHNFHVKDIDTAFQEESNWEKYIAELKRKGSMTLESEHVNIWTGKRFKVEVTVRYIHINGTGYLISNSRDITERKRVENLLITQEEKYRNIIANMNLGILEVDLDENIQYSNRSFRNMSGFTNRELKGKKTTDLFPSGENQSTIKEKSEKRAIGISDT
jgi:PAS domain S-box-containing protein